VITVISRPAFADAAKRATESASSAILKPSSMLIYRVQAASVVFLPVVDVTDSRPRALLDVKRRAAHGSIVNAYIILSKYGEISISGE
jgi:hypothetical protein